MPITANFAGKCRVCNKYYEKGDAIDKIPGEEDKGRVHASCARATSNNRETAQFHERRGVVSEPPRVSTSDGLVKLRDGLSLALEGVEEMLQSRNHNGYERR